MTREYSWQASRGFVCFSMLTPMNAVNEKQCSSCGEQVPENCVRCRTCGEFLYEETKQFHEEARQAASEPIWMVAYSGQKFGPFTREQLQTAFVQNSVPATALVWKPGLADWITVSKVADLNPTPGSG